MAMQDRKKDKKTEAWVDAMNKVFHLRLGGGGLEPQRTV